MAKIVGITTHPKSYFPGHDSSTGCDPVAGCPDAAGAGGDLARSWLWGLTVTTPVAMGGGDASFASISFSSGAAGRGATSPRFFSGGGAVAEAAAEEQDGGDGGSGRTGTRGGAAGVGAKCPRADWRTGKAVLAMPEEGGQERSMAPGSEYVRLQQLQSERFERGSLRPR